MLTREYKKGSVALTTVIIISGILIFGGVVAVISSIDVINATNNNINVEISKIYSGTCFQESLHKLKTNPGYEGTVNYADNGNNCSAVVTTNSGNSDIKDIQISSTYNNHTFTEFKQIDTSTDPFEIID